MTTIDTRKIAALARAGLTDDQIEQVCALFPSTASAPAPEPAASAAEQHPAETRRRDRNARAKVLTLVARGPCNVVDLAQQVYGDASLRSLKCVDRMAGRLAEDGLVSRSGDQVAIVSDLHGLTPAKPEPVTPVPARKVSVSTAKAAEMRLDAIIDLCAAIRSDAVRAGGHIEGTLEALTRPHRRLLDAASFDLPRTTVRPLSGLLTTAYTPKGAVVGGLRWMRGPLVGHRQQRVWVVSAV